MHYVIREESLETGKALYVVSPVQPVWPSGPWSPLSIGDAYSYQDCWYSLDAIGDTLEEAIQLAGALAGLEGGQYHEVDPDEEGLTDNAVWACRPGLPEYCLVAPENC